MNIHYISAPCGAGKTTHLLDFYKNRIQPTNSRLVIAQTTTVLIDATVERFKSHGFNPHAVYRGNGTRSASSAFRAALADPSIDLIFVTHKTLLDNPQFEKANKENTYLYVDEIPSIETSYSINLDANRNLIVDHLNASTSDIEGYLRLVRNEVSAIFEDVKRNKKDDVWLLLSDLFKAADSKHHSVHCTNEMWTKFSNKRDDSSQFIAHILTKASIFENWNHVTIMGANFENSMLFKSWTHDGVELKPSPFANLPTSHSEEVGLRATINFCLTENWSKSLMEKHDPLPVFAQAVEKHFDGKPYLFSVNNDVSESVVSLFKSGTQLPPMAQGLNEYRHYNAACYLPALNDTPAHIRFLSQAIDVSAEEILHAKSAEACYQFVMRTSLRMPEIRNKVEIVVADLRTAKFLHNVLPGSTLKDIATGVVLETKPVAMTATERKNKFRETKKREQAIVAAHEATDAIRFGFSATGAKNKETLITEATWPELASMLESLSLNQIATKEDNGYITPSGTRDDKTRFDTINLMMIDVDGTTVAPKAIGKALPYANVVYSTHSNDTRTGVHRYRIVMPMAAAIPLEEAKAISKEVIKQVQVAFPAFKADVISPKAIYYLPCQAASGRKADSVFVNASASKPILQPAKFAGIIAKEQVDAEWEQKRLAAHFASLPKQEMNDNRVNAVLNEELATYQNAPKGTGDKAFFRLVSRLVNRTNLSDGEITYFVQSSAHTRAASVRSETEARLRDLPNKISKAREYKRKHMSA